MAAVTTLIGRQLGRYQIEEPIGRGGMARVYKALDTSLRRLVALKVLAPQLSIDPEFIQRFEREAVTAANLRHPSIVTVYDVGEHDGLHYIAMELVRGLSLHVIVRQRGALGLSFATGILTPLCQALDYAHSKGAVHRDIKPHNVLIDLDGRVLLTDFGIAQVSEPGEERLTRTGMFMGTPEYISPEQARGEPVDGCSDLYSLGIVAYEVLTGRVPFAGATPQLIVAHANNLPPPPSLIDPSLPKALDAVLDKALAKQPRDRYQEAARFADELQRIARRTGQASATMAQIAELARAVDATELQRPSVPPLPDPLQPPPGSSLPPTMRGPTPVRPFEPLGNGGPTVGGSTLARDDQDEPLLPEQPERRRLPLLLLLPIIALFVALLIMVLRDPQSAPAAPTAAPTAENILPPPSDPIETAAPTQLLPTAAPTPAPTEAPTPAPTEAPTPTLPPLAPTVQPPAPPPPPPPPPPITAPPVETEAPVTEAPITEEPITEEPVTEAPVTEAPVTEVPTTEDPYPLPTTSGAATNASPSAAPIDATAIATPTREPTPAPPPAVPNPGGPPAPTPEPQSPPDLPPVDS
jgi:eukaryotic-like serine/threonine-protein kinase